MASVAAPTNTTLPAVATAPIGLDAKPASAPIYQAPPTPPLSDDEREAAKASTKSEPIVVDDASSAAPSAPTFERRMGDTELSYYLPSRADGVNDMYLHLGFTAPPRLVSDARVRTVWAILRLRHPPLAAHVELHSYDDVRFV